MWQRFSRLLGLACVSVMLGLVLGLSAPASAVTIYTYAGRPFSVVSGPYTTSMSVTGTITLSSPIPANSATIDVTPYITAFSISDGITTITQLNNEFGQNSSFLFSTNATGDIVSWGVSVDILNNMPGDAFIYTNNGTGISPFMVHDEGRTYPNGVETVVPPDTSPVVFDGSNDNSPGFWTVTPEPGTATLIAVGLAMLGWGCRATLY